jgi:hypothetical protein
MEGRGPIFNRFRKWIADVNPAIAQHQFNTDETWAILGRKFQRMERLLGLVCGGKQFNAWSPY